MPSNTQTKQALNKKKQPGLHKACMKSLAAFGKDGATIEKLVLAIRKCSNLDVASENSPNGEQALKALLQHEKEFEKVGKDRYRLAPQAAPSSASSPRRTPKKGQKRDLEDVTPSESNGTTPNRVTRLKHDSKAGTPGAQPRSQSTPAKDRTKPSTTTSASTPKASAGSAKTASATKTGPTDESAPKADPGAVLDAAIENVSSRITRLQAAVEAAKAHVDEVAAKAPAATPAEPSGSGASTEADGIDILHIDPSTIDVTFIDKCTALPQEVLDEVPPALKSFMGRPDDRKALMAFKRQRAKEIRKIIQSAQKKAAAAKKKQLSSGNKEVDVATKALAKQESLLKSAQRHLAALQGGGLAEFRKVAAVSDFVRVEAAATKAVQKAAQRREALAQRVAAKAARGELRKTERSEAKEAKEAKAPAKPLTKAEQLQQELKAAELHPIDDQDLLGALKKAGADHAAVVRLPVQPLPARDSEDELLTLYIADFLHNFHKTLDVPRMTLSELREALSGDPEAGSTSLLRQALFQLTTVIVQDLMDAGSPSRQDKRWNAALTPGTWQEVLRRYMLTRVAQAEPPLAPLEAAQAAFAMSALGFDGLPPQQKLAFLAAVCDEVLDTDVLRAELQERSERVDQTSKETRLACIEERRKLRELQEEERELKKQHREELAATPATSGEAKPSATNGKDNGGNVQEATNGAVKNGAAKDGKGPTTSATSARKRQMDAAEKAMAARVTKTRAACDDTISRLETKLEQSTRRNGIRGAIAGHDRQWLPVWHRVAGEKRVLVAADATGAVAVLDMQEDLAQYCATLDTRGVRECGLHAVLQSTMPSLARRSAAVKAAVREEQPMRVQPKRQTREATAAAAEPPAATVSTARKPTHPAAFAPFAMEAAALKTISERVEAAVEALVAKEDCVSKASAKTLQKIGRDVQEACAAMLLQNTVDDGLATLRGALRQLDTVIREVCWQQSHKLLASSSSEEEEEQEDGDEEMADAEAEEEEEEEEDDDVEEDEEEEQELRELEATMAECAVALAKTGAMPSQDALDIIAAGADHATEEYSGARRRDRPWWDGQERRVWQREVDDAGTPAAVAYLLASLLGTCKRLVDSA